MGGKLWRFLLLGCCLLAGCQQTETVSVPPVVGCYPVEGYAPDPADLAAPYTCTGGGRLIYGQGKGPQNVVLFLVSCVFSI